MNDKMKFALFAVAFALVAAGLVFVVSEADSSYADGDAVAAIGETQYTSLSAAADAAKNDETIVILADIDFTGEALVIGDSAGSTTSKDNYVITIDLNGHTINFADDGFKVFYATLNITGNGSVYCGTGHDANEWLCVWATTGSVVNILGGNYYSTTMMDSCIYAMSDGVINISGGEFFKRGETSSHGFLLNVKNDAADAKIYVTGGVFHGYNPAIGDDAKNTSSTQESFLPTGYMTLESPEGTFTAGQKIYKGSTETTTTSVVVNESVDIVYLAELSDVKLSASTDNSAIAMVDYSAAGKAVVWGAAQGTTTIHIWGSVGFVEYSSDVTVTVNPAIEYSQATVANEISVYEGTSVDLGLVTGLSGKTVTISRVADTPVSAYAEQQGDAVRFFGADSSLGNAKFEVYATFGNVQYWTLVTVTVNEPLAATKADSATVRVNESVDVALVDALAGQTVTITRVTDTPVSAAAEQAGNSIRFWGIDNTLGAAKFEISAVYENVRYVSVVTVTVTAGITYAGATDTPSASVMEGVSVDVALVAALSDKTLSVDSSNYAIATVEASAGKVTIWGQSVGTATIYIWGTYDNVEYWSEVTVTVEGSVIYHGYINANNGTGAKSDPIEIHADWAEITLPDIGDLDAMTYTGYLKVGYNTQADGSGQDLVFGEVVAVADVIALADADRNVNIYLVWDPITYTVAFDANGGTGTMDSMQITYDDAKALTAVAFTRADYAFAGWATAADGKVVYGDGATVSNLTAADGATVTLFAAWLQVEKKDNTAEITVTTDTVSDQAAQAVVDAAKGMGAGSTAVINASETDDVSVKSDYVKDAADNGVNVTIGTKSGSLELSAQAMKNLNIGTDATLKTEIKSVETPSGYDLGKNAVVYSILLTSDGTPYTTQFGTAFTVKLAYTPASGEDTSKLKVYYLADDGKLEEMADCQYADGFVTFTTTHLSQYAVSLDVDAKDTSGTMEFLLIFFVLIAVLIATPILASKAKKN